MQTAQINDFLAGTRARRGVCEIGNLVVYSGFIVRLTDEIIIFSEMCFRILTILLNEPNYYVMKRDQFLVLRK